MTEPKVAFYVYPTAFQAPGGGEVQLQQTKKHLEQLGLSIKLFDPWADKLKDFDILHTFGSVKDCLPVMQSAQAQGIKNVLSTICWYSWKSSWHTYSEPKTRALNVIRQAAKEFFPFLPSERKSMMQCSDLLLPNSQSEAGQLSRYFCIPQNRIKVVPNGVESGFANATPDLFHKTYGIKDFILSVGRIEPRKNQLNVIRALKGIEYPVVFIGDYVPHYKDYYDACRREAGNNVHFLGPAPHGSDLLKSAYAACDTFVLATWLETPGLAALEAGLAGAKVVITQEGATREYFKDYALYVRPENSAEIRRQVLKSYKNPFTNDLKNHIRKNYLWESTARQTLDAYHQVLKG